MNNNTRESSLFHQITHLIDLTSLFDNEIFAFALVDKTASVIQSNPLFCSLTGISHGLVSQNLFNYDLFNHIAFSQPFEELNRGVINEFSISRYLNSKMGKRSFFRIKGIKVNEEQLGEAILLQIEDVTDHWSLECIIENIGQSLNNLSNKNFFNSMCTSFSESLGVEMVFIGEFIREDESLRSISFLANGRFVPEMSFQISGTPTAQVMKTNKMIVFENEVQKYFPTDPGLRYWKVNSYIGCPLIDSKGDFIGYIAFMDNKELVNPQLAQSVLRIYSHNISCELERMKQQERIEEGQFLYKLIYDRSPFGIVSSTSEGKLIGNYQFCKMLGYTQKELGQLTRHDIGHPDDENAHLKARISKSGQVVFKKRYIKKDGSICYCKVRVSNINNDNNGTIDTSDLSGNFVLIEDISSKVEIQNKLKENEDLLNKNLVELNKKNTQLQKYIDSNLQLENFAHIASHDLKEPLRSIGNFSQLLSKKLKGRLTKTEEEFFNFILIGVKNMNQLIEDLLLYSSVNDSEIRREKMDLNEILFNVSRYLDKAILDSKAEVTFYEMPTNYIGSKTKLKQLFQNLISNALKFKRKGVAPKVEIKCADAGDFWKFSVSDNGIGIKINYAEKIFLIFKKLHSKSEYQGTGIGLAVCKKIVEQHGGEIWVESTEGKGTTFFFTLLKRDRCELE